MKKKQYMKPTQRVIELQNQSHLLSGSQVRSLGSGSPFDDISSDEDYYGGAR